MILSYLFHIFIGFLSGSILYSYLWPKWICHMDITQLSDDHNPGTFNAMKLAGPRVGILSGLRCLQGLLPSMVCLQGTLLAASAICRCAGRSCVWACVFPVFPWTRRQGHCRQLWLLIGAMAVL